jgi:hypothetical protein
MHLDIPGALCSHEHLLVSRLLACDSNRLGDVIQAANTLLLSLLSLYKIENRQVSAFSSLEAGGATWFAPG